MQTCACMNASELDPACTHAFGLAGVHDCVWVCVCLCVYVFQMLLLKSMWLWRIPMLSPSLFLPLSIRHSLS